MKITKVDFPVKSALNATYFDYVDSYQGAYTDEKDKISATDIGKAFFTSAPKWTAALFYLRNNLKKLTISTTAKFNNWFGKLYLLPVKPFHKLIVPIMLRRMIKKIETRN